MASMQRPTIITLASRLQHSRRLSAQDKIDAFRWENTALSIGYDRIVVHAIPGYLTDIEGDFVLIYRLGYQWARWGIARKGSRLAVWRCGTGEDIGLFATMVVALRSIPPASEAYQKDAPSSEARTLHEMKKPMSACFRVGQSRIASLDLPARRPASVGPAPSRLDPISARLAQICTNKIILTNSRKWLALTREASNE